MRFFVFVFTAICLCNFVYSDCETESYLNIHSEGFHDESLADASAHTQILNLKDAGDFYRFQIQSIATVDQYAPAFEELPYSGYYGLRAEIGRPNNAQGRWGWKIVDVKSDSYHNNFTNEIAKAAINLRVLKQDGWDKDDFKEFHDMQYAKVANAGIWAFRVIAKRPVIVYPDGTVSLYFYTIKYDHDTDYLNEEGIPINKA